MGYVITPSHNDKTENYRRIRDPDPADETEYLTSKTLDFVNLTVAEDRKRRALPLPAQNPGSARGKKISR